MWRPAVYLVLIVAFGGFAFWLDTVIDNDRDACRAQHPGYECVRGWVQGEAFRP